MSIACGGAGSPAGLNAMRNPAFNHAAWFTAGAILGGAAAGFWLPRPGTGGSSAGAPSVEAAPPRKPGYSKLVESAVMPDPKSALDRALTSPPGLQRSRDFLTFLEGVNAGNWEAQWERFSAATNGEGAFHDQDAKSLLHRIGEVAGAAGTDWFLRAGKTKEAGEVLTAWASLEPRPALEWLEMASEAEILGPALIKGIGLHSIDSLLEFAGTGPSWAFRDLGAELMAAARLKGTPEQGEELWRHALKDAVVAEAGQTGGSTWPTEAGGLYAMFRSLTDWQVESAAIHGNPSAARDWLSGILAEGYRTNEQNLSAVGAVAGKADPEGTLLWASEMARLLSNGDPVQLQRITRQQGYQAAQHWAKKDAMALSQWLTANPAHPAYDTGAAALYLSLKEADPAAAGAWGAVVKDESLRQWTKLDPFPPSQ